MTESLLPYEVVQPADPTRVLIWMHGLGADGHDFIPMAHALNLPGVKWVFPHAPERSITINQGMLMRAWYDIKSLDRLDSEDIQGLQNSRWQIRELIEHERQQGFALEDIMIGGFSQGGVMALYAGLSYEKPLNKIIALSCYLPMLRTFDEWRAPENQHTDIFMAHGHYDPILPIVLAQTGLECLKSTGYEVDWHDYPMGHQVCDQEIEALRTFITT